MDAIKKLSDFKAETLFTNFPLGRQTTMVKYPQQQQQYAQYPIFNRQRVLN